MLLFPDSNFFLQCRHPAEIPWSEITADEEVRLFASRTVQGEIDRFKGDGKGRRSNRARTVSSWFGTVIDKGVPYVLRDHSPRVTLDLPPRMPPGHPYPPGLDATRADDRIVGEVLAFREIDAEAFLLTDDTNMKATARHEALPFIPIPDTWRLDPEPDAKDKTIADLQKRLTLLERSSPVIEVIHSLVPKTSVVSRRMRYGALPETVVEELVEALRSIWPEKTDFSREAYPDHPALPGMPGFHSAVFAGMEWKAPSAAAISDYGRRHAAWLDAVRVHLRRLHRSLPRTRLRLDARWVLRNTGTVPAEGMIIDIEALGGVVLMDPRSPIKEASRDLPEPPVPPAGKMSPMGLGKSIIDQAAFRAAQSGLRPPLVLEGLTDHSARKAPRDPYTFHRRAGPVRALNRRWSFECSEFRHGGEPKIFEAIAVTVGPSDSGALRFRASARNMPIPVETVLPIRVASTVESIEDEACALVDLARRADEMRRRYPMPLPP